MAAWQKTVPACRDCPAEPGQERARLPQGELTVVRGRPRDSENIAALINRVQKDGQRHQPMI